MDLDLYQQLIRRYWPVFLGIVGVTILAAWLFTARATTAPPYVGTQFIAVAQRPQVETQGQYQFGEFYSLQGSAFLAEFFTGWLQDPATVQAIFRDAGLTAPTSSLRSLDRTFELRLRGRSGFQILVERDSGSEARALLAAAGSEVTDRLAALQRQGLYPDVVLVPGEITAGPTLPDLAMNLIIGAVVGLFLGGVALLALSLTLPRRS